jgi:hypothetical protein
MATMYKCDVCGAITLSRAQLSCQAKPDGPECCGVDVCEECARLAGSTGKVERPLWFASDLHEILILGIRAKVAKANEALRRSRSKPSSTTASVKETSCTCTQSLPE